MSRKSDLELLDGSITQARADYHAAETYLAEIHYLRACNRLQRLRFRMVGSFLPSQNGQIHTYDTGMGYWTNWQAASLAPTMAG